MTGAFVTVFMVFGLGFTVQRLRPLNEQTLTQLAGLVVDILLPFYLFYTTATVATPEELRVAPTLVVMGGVFMLVGYAVAQLAIKPAAVGERQQAAFRFSVMVGNTAFLGIPICQALFGPLGAVYAVLFDFGATLLTLSFGIWVLSGGRLDNWRPLIFNPLIWGVAAGLGWAAAGWPFPEWLAGAFDTMGGATLPMALLVAGAQVGNVRTRAWNLWRPLSAMLVCRLLAVPLLMAGLVLLLGLQGQPAAVIILEAGMPVGLVTAIMARSYGADGEYASSAILWSNLAALATLPVLALLVS